MGSGPTTSSPAPPTLWFRRFFGALLAFAFAFVVLEAIQPLVGGEVAYDRLGLMSRALRVTPAHLPLAFAVMASGSALWARRAGRAAWICGLSLGGLFLAELIMSPSRAFMYSQPYPDLGWWHGEADTAGLRQDHEKLVTPEGFVGTEPVPRRFAGKRAICLGDSFTWGAGAPQGEEWPALAARRAGFPFLNAGNLGYGVDQMATLYSGHLAKRYDHGAVFVCVIEDDLRRATDRFFLIFRKPFTPPGGEVESVPPPVQVFGIAFCPEPQVLAPWRECARHVGQEIGLLPDGWAHLADALAKIRAAAGTRSAYLLALSTRGDGGRHGERICAAARAARFEGAAAVDLTGCYVPDGHPDPRGHERIAEAAVALIQNRSP
jgi:hypothetical protein